MDLERKINTFRSLSRDQEVSNLSELLGEILRLSERIMSLEEKRNVKISIKFSSSSIMIIIITKENERTNEQG